MIVRRGDEECTRDGAAIHTIGRIAPLKIYHANMTPTSVCPKTFFPLTERCPVRGAEDTTPFHPLTSIP